MIIDATFTSVWDGGYEITTNCKVNVDTKEVFDIELAIGSGDIVETLDEEYITVGNKHYPVSNNKYGLGYWYD